MFKIDWEKRDRLTKQEMAQKSQIAELEELIASSNKDLAGRIINMGFELRSGINGETHKEKGYVMDTIDGTVPNTRAPSNIR